VFVLHLALLHIGGEANVVMRCQQQARALLPLEPIPDGVDFPLLRLLLGHEVVQAELHQRIRVGKTSFINWQFVARLVDALVNGRRSREHPDKPRS
jgi:hypothetical protein